MGGAPGHRWMAPHFLVVGGKQIGGQQSFGDTRRVMLVKAALQAVLLVIAVTSVSFFT